jgi:hypothetical protein
MNWKNLKQSVNVTDRRKKIIGVIVGGVAIVSGLFLHGPDLPEYIKSQVTDTRYAATANNTKQVEFVKTMLFITETEWASIFKTNGLKYIEPKLVLFTDSVTSSCGLFDADIGPFYCFNDSTIYMDLHFLNILSNNLNIIGDASQAYIIFHEVGHHVQNLTQVLPAIQLQINKYLEKNSETLSIRLELQADCYAGIMFNKSKRILEPGDVAEIVNAAARIGDDWLQSRSGKVMPDTFTHGTSEQRSAWLLHGYKQGTMESCDTFKQSDDITKL